MNRKLMLVAVVAAFGGGMVMADEAQIAQALRIVQPMMEEIAPGAAGVAFSECVVAHATPDELATLAGASGPSTQLGNMITAILARPETMACATEKLS